MVRNTNWNAKRLDQVARLTLSENEIIPGLEVQAMPTIIRKAILLCPVEDIWDALTNVSDYQWRRNVSRVRKEDENRFYEYDENGRETEVLVTKKETCKNLVCSYKNERMTGRVFIKLEGRKNRTIMIITEVVNGTAKEDPSVPGGMTRKRQARFLADLKKKLNCKELNTVPIM